MKTKTWVGIIVFLVIPILMFTFPGDGVDGASLFLGYLTGLFVETLALITVGKF